MSVFQVIGSGLAARRSQIDVIANNIANINTVGFKSSRLITQDRPYRQTGYLGLVPDELGAVEQQPLSMGSGVLIAESQRLTGQGQLRETGRGLDVGIRGEGFLAVQGPDGTIAYTRDGALLIDGQGQLVTAEGWRLVPPVTIPADAVRVAVERDGTVTAERGRPGSPEAVGQITLTTFSNPTGLLALGENLLKQSPASGDPLTGPAGAEGRGEIISGFLEGSNVDFAAEMTRLVQAQRAYQLNVRLLQTWDEMAALATNLRR